MGVASIYVPLILRNHLLALFFIPIIIIVSIALMNLVTAVLVEGAMQQTEKFRQDAVIDMRTKLRHQIPVLDDLFRRLDADNDGVIGFDELTNSDSSYFEGILEYLHLDSLSELFDIFDVDESGELSHDEFVEGVVSLWAAHQSGMS